MKQIRYTILLLAVVLTACQDALKQPLKFSVSVAPNDSVQQVSDTSYTAPVGTSVKFLFSGEPDFISLTYNIFNETRPTLSFDHTFSWNKNNNNLQLLISPDFNGLSKSDAHADSALLRNHAWIDLTDSVVWAEGLNEVSHNEIDLTPYRGKKLTLAFRYHAPAGLQPMFTLSGLQIQSRLVKTGAISSTTEMSAMGWQAFDMLSLTPDSAAYHTGNGFAEWDLSDLTSIKYRQNKAQRAENEDWLLTRAVYIPLGKDDASVSAAIKNIYLNVEEYDFTFSESGEYILVFYASNANFEQRLQTTRTIKFVIYE